MKVIESVKEMQHTADLLRLENKKIGLVPTMGFLHEGHLSLIRSIRKRCDVCVVSIFVNATQFGPNEDFDRYPRNFKHDKELCENEGVDIIFHPPQEEMYSNSHRTFIITENLANKLCGISRPTHFRGVTTIVAKLFNVVKPHVAFFGQKDAQQSLLIRRMAEDLNMDVEIVMAPIVREADGLALSSRNAYLSETERLQSVVLNQSLTLAEQFIKKGERSVKKIKKIMLEKIDSVSAAQLDYLSFVDFENLESVEIIKNNTLIALAVYFGKTRLIDNMIVDIE